MTKRLILILSISFLCIWGCEEFFRRKIGGIAGSFPFVESWKIKASESEVLEAIKELKKDKSTLRPPNNTELIGKRDSTYDWGSDEMKAHLEKYLKDSLTPLPKLNKNNMRVDYWLFINFYYNDTKEIVYTWTRPDVMDSSITTLALVGFSIENDSTDYRKINRDFWYVSNKLQIRKFKKKILQPILDKIEERKKR